MSTIVTKLRQVVQHCWRRRTGRGEGGGGGGAAPTLAMAKVESGQGDPSASMAAPPMRACEGEHKIRGKRNQERTENGTVKTEEKRWAPV